MPLKRYQCPICGYVRETLRNRVPKCNHNQEEEGEPIPVAEMEYLMEAPEPKMLETVDPATNKKRQKGLTKVLKERARNHARDHDNDEIIQRNRDNQLTGTQLLNKDGVRRRKVDDI